MAKDNNTYRDRIADRALGQTTDTPDNSDNNG